MKVLLTVVVLLSMFAVGNIAIPQLYAWNKFSSARPQLSEEDEDEEEIEELMEELHEGRRSPEKKVAQALLTDPPKWETIVKELSRFRKMSRLLAEAGDEDIRDLADGYVEAIEELTEAAKVKNASIARKAHRALTNCCSDCHHKGGPGGELDDD